MRIVAMVFALATSWGCNGQTDNRSGGGSADRRPGGRPNVLLVSVDTLRADFALEGPFLSRMAEQGRRFSNAFSSSNWTLPSHVSLFTSRPYLEHNIPPPMATQDEGITPMPERWPNLATALRSSGYYTAATTEGGWLQAHFGFSAGFDRYESSVAVLHGGNAVLSDHIKLVDEFVTEAGDRPFFVFVHTYWVHDYFINSTEYHELLTEEDAPFARLGNLLENVSPHERDEIPADFVRRLYSAGVRRVDRFLEELVNGTRTASGDDPLIVVVTSDHGESLGERGIWGHGSSLDDLQIRIPLVVCSYGGEPIRGVSDIHASTIDVAPSLLSRLGVEIPESFRGSASLLTPTPKPSGSPVFARFYRNDHEQPFRGTIGQLLIDRETRYERTDRFDGSRVDERCSGIKNSPPTTYDLVFGDVSPCAQSRDAYTRLRSQHTYRSVEIRATEPVMILLDEANNGPVAVHPAVPSPDPLVEAGGRQVSYSPLEHGPSLVLYARGPDLLFDRIEVGGETVARGLRLSNLVADARGTVHWETTTAKPATLSLTARGLGPGAEIDPPPPDPELLEHLKALGYVDSD
jgi:arylsulfatase A-like enzyme